MRRRQFPIWSVLDTNP